ncbi:hypothetical protein XELAEV_18037015mg [Xenopus laevis]|uniref:Uncharacterized protein n=1 Tax=Xenopus laevis TaxID=8355 RepID=A0A974CBJ1_XENLA|nr:hypothetical protein XELAEV_18037015mg [Xenopus laevis]
MLFNSNLCAMKDLSCLLCIIYIIYSADSLTLSVNAGYILGCDYWNSPLRLLNKARAAAISALTTKKCPLFSFLNG